MPRARPSTFGEGARGIYLSGCAVSGICWAASAWPSCCRRRSAWKTRATKQKSAGLRTHTLVGVGAALFMLVSKYGFYDVLSPDEVLLDPSRVAAQIVSGIGFIGGGLIFVRRDVVSGLTTAASIWLTAAIGMAAGGGLALLAVAATLAYLLVTIAYPLLARRLPRRRGRRRRRCGSPTSTGAGVLREALARVTGRGLRRLRRARLPPPRRATTVVTVDVEVRGPRAADRAGDRAGRASTASSAVHAPTPTPTRTDARDHGDPRPGGLGAARRRAGAGRERRPAARRRTGARRLRHRPRDRRGEYGWAPPGEDRLVLGHESLGRVREAPDGSGFAPGDLVVGIVRRPDPEPCAACAHGEWDMCRNGNYTERGIKELHGYGREQWRVEPDFALKLDPALETSAYSWSRTRWWSRHGSRSSASAPGRLRPSSACSSPAPGRSGSWRRCSGCSAGSTWSARPGDQRPEARSRPRSRREVPPRRSTAEKADHRHRGHRRRRRSYALAPRGKRHGIVCLTGVSAPGHRIDFEAGVFNGEAVLHNAVVVGTVNANQRHYEAGADALASADASGCAG